MQLENLANGEVRHARIPEDGTFRIAVPADGMDYYEKRVAGGIPDIPAISTAVFPSR